MLASALATVVSSRAISSGFDMLSQASMFAGFRNAVRDSINSSANVIGGLSDAEMISKGFSGVAKRAFSLFKKISHLDS